MEIHYHQSRLQGKKKKRGLEMTLALNIHTVFTYVSSYHGGAIQNK